MIELLGIKQAMQNKGISIETIARFLGLHQNSVSNKVNGKTAFSVDEALDLQTGLFPEYTMSYLFTSKKDADQGGNPGRHV